MKDKVGRWTERKQPTCRDLIQPPHSSDVGKALATDLKQTTDVSHKLSGCFTSRVGFFLTVIHTVPSLSNTPWQGLMSNSMPKLQVHICFATANTDMWMIRKSLFFDQQASLVWQAHHFYKQNVFFKSKT